METPESTLPANIDTNPYSFGSDWLEFGWQQV
jgi:hypothetical protein